jgi:hypothetical protein
VFSPSCLFEQCCFKAQARLLRPSQIQQLPSHFFLGFWCQRLFLSADAVAALCVLSAAAAAADAAAALCGLPCLFPMPGCLLLIDLLFGCCWLKHCVQSEKGTESGV